MPSSTLKIPAHVLAELNAILADGNLDRTGEDVYYAATAEFDNGVQADIKLVNGDPPYVDPVLFDAAGHEIAIGCPGAETFDGTYKWHVDDVEYEVVVEAGQP